MKDNVRILIVEDTLTGQGLLKGILAEDPHFEVVGIATDGEQAIDMVAKLSPDVVSMDIYMPKMDGVVATRHIMKQSPVPIVIVSSFYTPDEIKMSFKILEAGALTILPKPCGPGDPQYNHTAKTYRNTLKMMSEIKVGMHKAPGNSPPKPHVAVLPVLPGGTIRHANYKIVAIGASAGGPLIIQEILAGLPKDFPCPIVIVQHIDANFASGFCDWLNTASNLPVIIARDGETMLPGHVYMPPGDHHLGLHQAGVVSITKDAPERGLRPAVGYLFRHVAEKYGKKSIGILLSGMGADGAMELKKLRDQGAWTIAQDEATSLVHGMPGVAIRMGAACIILSPQEIITEINNLTKM